MFYTGNKHIVSKPIIIRVVSTGHMDDHVSTVISGDDNEILLKRFSLSVVKSCIANGFAHTTSCD